GRARTGFGGSRAGDGDRAALDAAALSRRAVQHLGREINPDSATITVLRDKIPPPIAFGDRTKKATSRGSSPFDFRKGVSFAKKCFCADQPPIWSATKARSSRSSLFVTAIFSLQWSQS